LADRACAAFISETCPPEAGESDASQDWLNGNWLNSNQLPITSYESPDKFCMLRFCF
jgi:hypothetical protein